MKRCSGDYTTLLPAWEELPAEPEALQALRRRCEMVLVREFDDWYVGEPTKNISQAIHRYVSRLQNPDKRPTTQVNRIAAVLAWTYALHDLDSADTYVLLEQVCDSFPTRQPDRFLPAHIRKEMLETLEVWREVRGVPPSLSSLSKKETRIWREVSRWENQPRTLFTPVGETIGEVGDAAMEALPDAVMRDQLSDNYL